MAVRDTIVVGASAGGVEALLRIVAALPASLPAAVLVVLHVPADSPSRLPSILARAGKLRVVDVRVDPGIENGRILIAPPDHHLTVRDGKAHLSRGPRVNRHRPAIDPLFRTAALEAGARVIGVVLSGTLDDGTSGMMMIKRHGGVTIVQDPVDALYGSMPRSVLEQTTVDRVLPAEAIAAALVELAGQPVPDPMRERMAVVGRDAVVDIELTVPNDPSSPPSGFICPDCHGALWSVGQDTDRFRCRVGHAFTSNGLFAAQAEALEEAMWTAYRALEESAALSARLAARARAQALPSLAERYASKHEEAMSRADLIREVLERGSLDAEPTPSRGKRDRGKRDPAAEDP